MSAHTPGPWLPGPWVVEAAADRNVVGVADASGNPICELWHGVEGWTLPSRCTTKEWKLDHARLIAAAPDLLAALEWMVAHDDTNEGDDPVESLGGQTWNEYNAYWLAGLEQARAAIAKAKGEQP